MIEEKYYLENQQDPGPCPGSGQWRLGGGSLTRPRNPPLAPGSIQFEPTPLQTDPAQNAAEHT